MLDRSWRLRDRGWRQELAGVQRDLGGPNDPPPVGGQAIPINPYWAACRTSGIDDRYKVVTDHTKDPTLDPRMTEEYVRLYSGRYDTVKRSDGTIIESKFGYRHIQDKHRSEFLLMGAEMGRGWQAMADWILAWVARDPFVVTTWGGGGRQYRFCYERKFYFLVDDNVVKEQWAVMITGRTGVRVMSLFLPDANDGNYCSTQGGEIVL